jgi:hypothetical protein
MPGRQRGQRVTTTSNLLASSDEEDDVVIEEVPTQRPSHKLEASK